MKNLNLEINYYKNKNIKPIYTPTFFWNKLINNNYKAIKNGKLKIFRNQKGGFSGFVPFHSEIRRFKVTKNNLIEINKLIYSFKIITKAKKKISNLIFSSLSGLDRAKDSYKTLLTDNIKPYFHNFKESKVGKPTEQFSFNNSIFSASSLNYLTGLLFLKNSIKKLDNKVYLEIGGGFGTVGEILIKLKIKNIKYINLDLPPLNIISKFYLQNACRRNVTDHFDFQKKDVIKISELKTLSCFPNFDIEKFKGKIDVFINFISFQEMEYDVVKNYIDKIFILCPKYILLRNLREGKNTKINKNKYKHSFNHFVKKPIKKGNYIKLLKKNYNLINSNVEPYGFKTWDNYNSELLLFKKR
jgi:putative sugar O-methyltransferase